MLFLYLLLCWVFAFSAFVLLKHMVEQEHCYFYIYEGFQENAIIIENMIEIQELLRGIQDAVSLNDLKYSFIFISKTNLLFCMVIKTSAQNSGTNKDANGSMHANGLKIHKLLSQIQLSKGLIKDQALNALLTYRLRLILMLSFLQT